MPFDLDDPRLTAYALGEIEDPAEIADVERLLADHDDARRLIAEIRSTAALLTEQLHAESSPGLAPSQHKAIAGSLATRRGPFRLLSRTRMALAASLLAAAGTAIGVYQTRRPNPAPPPIAAHAPAPVTVLDSDLAEIDIKVKSQNEGLALNDSFAAKDLTPEAEATRGKERDMAAPTAPPPSPSNPELPAGMAAPAAIQDGSVRTSDTKARFGSALSRGLPEPPPGYVAPKPTQRGRGIAEQPTREEIDALALGVAADKPASYSLTKPNAPQSGPVASPAETVAESQRRNKSGAPNQLVDAEGAIQGVGESARAAGLQDAQQLPAIQVRPRMGDEKAERRRHLSGRPEVRESAPQAAVALDFERGGAQATPEVKKLAEIARVDQAGKPAAVGAEPQRFFSEIKGAELEHEKRKAPEQLVEAKDRNDAVGFSIAAATVAPPRPNREAFARIVDHPFARVLESPRSTFSIDVDTAAYSIMRRYLMAQGLVPPPDALRLEELINAVRYDDPEPKSGEPFAVHVEIARCPWRAEHRLARISLRGRSIPAEKRPPGNLVFLVDASGSMAAANKLPLLKTGLRMLTEQLGEGDRVAIVAYSDTARVVLGSTPGERKSEVLAALDTLRAQGSTNGAEGLVTAYKIASEQFLPEGNNRVLIATDGDFNVGITSVGDLERLIAEKAKSKVFLTVLGFGTGNLQDDKLEALADKGDGQYHYIDSEREARKVLVEELSGTLLTVAKDVKVQVDFNPVQVGAYRQIGYENRALAARDFQDQAKDAGELGAGQTVTALYELVPAGKEDAIPAADAPRFVKPAAPADPSARESFIVRVNSKDPEGNPAPTRTIPVIDTGRDYAEASPDFKFAAAIASFGMLLRDSPFKGTATFDAILELAEASKGKDPNGERAEFLAIVRKAKTLVIGPAR